MKIVHVTILSLVCLVGWAVMSNDELQAGSYGCSASAPSACGGEYSNVSVRVVKRVGLLQRLRERVQARRSTRVANCGGVSVSVGCDGVSSNCGG